MKFYFFLFLIFLVCCTDKNTLREEKATKETEFVTNDTIPEIRRNINKNAVDSYLVKSQDKYLDYKFGVKVFETPKTFQYLLEMNYDGMKVKDTLKLPNFGTWPVVVVKPTKEKLTCIIGFLDKEKNFKEYKMLTAVGDKLKLKVLNRYYVGSYRTEY
ncbi:MAG TPA: hypothetical protein VF623_00615 [Segetibacter sp.]